MAHAEQPVPARSATGSGHLRQTAPAQAPASIIISWLLPADIGIERDFGITFVQQFQKWTSAIQIEATFEPWAAYSDSLAAALASDAPPDIVHVGAPVVQEYGLLGTLRDLAPAMQQDALSKDDFFPFLIDQMTDFRTRSQLWAVPKDSAVYVVYYNKDLFDRAGVAYPRMDWTFDTFREKARQLTFDTAGNPATSSQFDPDSIASWGMDWGSLLADSPLPGSDLWQMIAWGQAGPWFSDDLSRAYLDDPDHIEFVRQIVEMRCTDNAIPKITVRDDGGDRWRQGRVAMSIAQYAQSYFHQAERRTFAYDIVAAPAGPRGQFNAATCNGWAIPVRAAHPEEAWTFIKFLVTPEAQAGLAQVKRWGTALKAAAPKLMPDSSQPASFKAALYDPMFGQSTVKIKPIVYPPYLGEMRRIWQTEFSDLFACGGGDVAAAMKRTQPQIQALLDKARSS